MRGHRGYNICPWLKNGKHEICGKSCREEYCKVHRAKIRNGSRISRPCLGCGIGIRSQIQLCRGCGREKERQRLAKTRVEQALPVQQALSVPPLEAMRPFFSFDLTAYPFKKIACAEECFNKIPNGVRDKCDWVYMTENEFYFGLRD